MGFNAMALALGMEEIVSVEKLFVGSMTVTELLYELAT
jgi:hypothetical protein